MANLRSKPHPTAPSATKKAAAKRTPGKHPAALPRDGKDPKGGLTAAGRNFYNEQTGGHLRPGVKGAANTPEKQQRKGSFLTRHFTTPPGPVVKDGKPTRQALQAAAWGEPVPKTEADEKALAAKGRTLLAKAKTANKKTAAKKTAAKKTAAKKTAAKKTAAKKTAASKP